MKHTAFFAGLLLLASVALLSFSRVENEPQSAGTEDYLMVTYYPGNSLVEKTISGKTEYIKLERQKVDGYLTSRPALMTELQTVNNQGFELTALSGNETHELYFFRKKK